MLERGGDGLVEAGLLGGGGRDRGRRGGVVGRGGRLLGARRAALEHAVVEALGRALGLGAAARLDARVAALERRRRAAERALGGGRGRLLAAQRGLAEVPERALEARDLRPERGELGGVLGGLAERRQRPGGLAELGLHVDLEAVQELAEQVLGDVVALRDEVVLLVLVLREEARAVEVLLRRVDDVARVRLEDEADEEGPAPGLAVVVDLARAVVALRVAEVLDHLPERPAEDGRRALEALLLVEADRVRLAVLVLLLALVELHRHDHVADDGGQAKRVDVAVVVEVAAPHHEVDHEREDAEDLHEVLVPVELGHRVGVRLRDEAVVVEVVRRPEEVLARHEAAREHARADRDLRADHGLRIGGGAAILRLAPPEGRAAGREAVGPLAEGRRQAVCQAAESHDVYRTTLIAVPPGFGMPRARRVATNVCGVDDLEA